MSSSNLICLKYLIENNLCNFYEENCAIAAEKGKL
jgi:hypothetical protein